MGSTKSLSREDLFAVFAKPPGVPELIGIEVESAPLDLRTGRGVPYHGVHGLGEFLAHCQDELGGEPRFERGRPVGIMLPDGDQISLENGGAVEYSSRPAASLVEAVEVTRRMLGWLGKIAEHHGFALVPGSNFPFTSIDDVHWVPNARGDIMRDHFASLGEASAWGREVMALTLSTQVTLDYVTEEDLIEKLRMQAAVSTVAAALFVNSPLEHGRHHGALSRRMQYWSRIDPARTRIIPVTIGDSVTLEGFVDWALSLPMIYHKHPDGSCEAAPARSFAELLATGFDDGRRPDASDWMAHLSQIYTDVRVRNTLEMRAVDSPPYDALPAVAAFWTGLTYHPGSRAAAWELLRHATVDQHYAALADIAVRGMAARFAGRPVRELAAELVRLSEAGLRARVAAGVETDEALAYLSPVREVAETGETFAEKCLHRWENEFERDPARYVNAYRV
ncbi:glutamate-cysteine ligase family protein [Kibdelosporangium persicum]|uniref:Glutamate--cysteine ligase n=1 Tax=Kibdelosporangium persicum TaxID=2698649 RepID=A0ABX2FJJ4_9PSEU|nr:glutamate-cysteine ligase family protein [Kibdelosporangium persicum]NRN71000.1 Glutamate--cysteine ligase [Kibdelosporangium persicum]